MWYPESVCIRSCVRSPIRLVNLYPKPGPAPGATHMRLLKFSVACVKTQVHNRLGTIRGLLQGSTWGPQLLLHPMDMSRRSRGCGQKTLVPHPLAPCRCDFWGQDFR